MQKVGIVILALVLATLACTTKKKVFAEKDDLSGIWELNYISGPRIAFDGLYPNRKPILKIEPDSNRISGHTSCNNFFGKLNRNGAQIHFNEGLGMTKMACPGQGEQVFLDALKKVDRYDISDKGETLQLIRGDIAIMRFKRMEK